jgi:hypothetical protein
MICSKPTMGTRIYCERCRPHIMSRKMGKLKRRAALIQALDIERDIFLCQISRLALEMENHSSPFWIQFDHIIPIKTSAFQALCAVFNEMKGDLADIEFRKLIILLRNHWLGTPFDKDAIKFEYWNRTKPKLARLMLRHMRGQIISEVRLLLQMPYVLQVRRREPGATGRIAGGVGPENEALQMLLHGRGARRSRCQ